MKNRLYRGALLGAAALTVSSLTGCTLAPHFETGADKLKQMEAVTEAETETEDLIPTESVYETEWETEEITEAETEETTEAIPRLLSLVTIKDYYLMRDYPLPPIKMDQLTSLEGMLKEQISDYDGNWSIYLKDLATDEEFLINDVAMRSASVMKLFVLGTVYDAFESKTLERTEEVTALMSGMITASSNEDTNKLLLLLGNGSYAEGVAKVNAFIQSNGYSELTHEFNGFQDEGAILDPDHFNQVGARDLGLLLTRVYHRTFGPRSACNEVENWMLAQETRYKIPAGIPLSDSVQTGNKTGETDDTENDAAVVYTPYGDYVLVVLSNSWGDKGTAQQRIASISAKVYSYYAGTALDPAAIPIPAFCLPQEVTT